MSAQGPQQLDYSGEQLPVGKARDAMLDIYRDWEISQAYIGYSFQHPGFDPENPSDWRYGHAGTVEAARDEIDALLAEDAEWDDAVAILKAAISGAAS